jgi:plastocyanin
MPRPTRPLYVAAILALGMAFSGLVANPPPAAAASQQVQIANSAFGPSALTVQVGDTVTWTNADDRPHTVTSDGGAFDSGNLDEGASFSFTFTAAGTYTYRCQYHPEMVATIVVQAASAAPAAPPASTAPAQTASTDSGTDATASHHTGGAGGQPDTAMPLPWSLPDHSLWLAGIGLMVIAIGFLPRRRHVAAVVEPKPDWSWRR